MERRIVQWNAEDVSLGSSLFRRIDDLWKLRPIQSAGRHSCRGILFGGMIISFMHLVVRLLILNIFILFCVE